MMNTLKTDIILLHSFPSGGKSTLSKLYETKGYIIISRDTLAEKLKNLTDEEKSERSSKGFVIKGYYVLAKGGGTSYSDLMPTLENSKGSKICLDNTHMTVDQRSIFIQFAKSENLTIGCHIIDGVSKKIQNPLTNKFANLSSKDAMKEQAMINSLHRMYSLNEDIYMTAKDVPDEVKNDGQSFVLPAIFNHNKNVKTPKKIEGFDEIIKSLFKRENRYLEYKNKAVFVDLDGTCRITKSGDKYPIKLGDVFILDNTQEVLENYKKQGYLIIGITNQSGIDRGHLTYKMADDLVKETNSLIGNVIDDYHICSHFPSMTTCYCRKPQSGTGVMYMHKYKLNLEECIMVGDRTEDFNFARRLGIKFITPQGFFGRMYNQTFILHYKDLTKEQQGGYEITELSEFEHHRGAGFTGNLYVKNRFVASIANEGYGGETTVRWVDLEEERVDGDYLANDGSTKRKTMTPHQKDLNDFLVKQNMRKYHDDKLIDYHVLIESSFIDELSFII